MTSWQQGDRLLAGLDLWESLRGFVLDSAPSASAVLAHALEADWRHATPRDRATAALGVILDLDIDSPSGRRHARSILREFERDGHLPLPGEPPAAVREDPPIAYHDLGQQRRQRIASDLSVAASDAFAAGLRVVPGAIAAVEYVERETALLKGQRAARFLRQIGFDVLVPDRARRRFLERLGLTGALAENREGRAAALRLFGDLAERSGCTLRELDALCGIFTGAGRPECREAALCTTRPKCGACPIAGHCAFGRYHRGQSGGNGRRRLADAMLPEDRPREKLAARGADALTNAELLAILLRTGSGKEHAVDLANRLLREAESLDRLARLSVSELCQHGGLGQVKAITIKAALELARRISHDGAGRDAPVSSARDVFTRLRGHFLDRQKEYFLALLLNTKNYIIRQVTVSEGTLNQSLVHPREAFQDAFRDSAAAVIFVHNHPSGDPAPSRDDHLITERLVKAGDLMGIKVLDHIIIGRERYFSFADEGMLRT